MVLSGIQNGNQDAYDTFGVCTVGGGEGGFVGGAGGAAGEEGAGEVSDGGYYHGEVVATIPESIV